MQDANFLKSYYLSNTAKRLHKWIHYLDIYEHHFHRFRGCSPVIVEIGVFGGGSLDMWKSYFGTGCKVIGVDINPEYKKYESDGVEIFIGGQQDPETIKRILEKHPHLDIVLDDGSHLSPHMTASFNMLYQHVNQNGIYMVEDTHACYWKEMGGGVKKQGSFMEFVKDRLDEINAPISRKQMPITEFAKSTWSINIYDSVVVFEKRPQGQRHAPATGQMNDGGVF